MSSVLGVSVGAGAIRLARPPAGAEPCAEPDTFDMRTFVVPPETPSAERAALSVAAALNSNPAITATVLACRDEQQARSLYAAMNEHGLTAYDIVPDIEAVLEFAVASGALKDVATLAVFDLGSSGLSVTVVDVPTRQVRHTERTGDISGEYFDSLIREQQINSGRIAHPPDPAGLAELDALCRSAKERLSSGNAVALPSSYGPVLLTQENFTALIGRAVETSARATREVIERSGRPVQALLAVGGGMRIPLVSRALREAVDLPILVPPEPETAAARGAMLLAGKARTRTAEADSPGRGARSGSNNPGGSAAANDSAPAADPRDRSAESGSRPDAATAQSGVTYPAHGHSGTSNPLPGVTAPIPSAATPNHNETSPGSSGTATNPGGISPNPGSSPNNSGTAPNLGGTAPNLGGTAPNLSGTAPNLSGTAPNLGGISPNLGGISPNAGGISQNSSGTSPNSGGASPSHNGISPNPGGTSPAGNGISPDLGGTSPNTNGASPNPGDALPNYGTFPALSEPAAYSGAAAHAGDLESGVRSSWPADGTAQFAPSAGHSGAHTANADPGPVPADAGSTSPFGNSMEYLGPPAALPGLSAFAGTQTAPFGTTAIFPGATTAFPGAATAHPAPAAPTGATSPGTVAAHSGSHASPVFPSPPGEGSGPDLPVSQQSIFGPPTGPPSAPPHSGLPGTSGPAGSPSAPPQTGLPGTSATNTVAPTGSPSTPAPTGLPSASSPTGSPSAPAPTGPPSTLSPPGTANGPTSSPASPGPATGQASDAGASPALPHPISTPVARLTPEEDPPTVALRIPAKLLPRRSFGEPPQRPNREISAAMVAVSALVVVASIGIGLGYGQHMFSKDSATVQGTSQPETTSAPAPSATSGPPTATATTTSEHASLAEPPPVYRPEPEAPPPSVTPGPNTWEVLPGLPPIVVPTIPPEALPFPGPRR
ncbi:Hsp70 family protein [Nocardia carnea]|uniref:Hsp70 family protein n=1 Tax=Nocardia carnea TaxID=37328 RepID=UPI002456F183|nr:Hsp70 family protein [Nocardia carnea]